MQPAWVTLVRTQADLDETAWYGDNSGLHRIDTAALLARYGDGPGSSHKALFENGSSFPPSRSPEAPEPWGLIRPLWSVSQWLAHWFDRTHPRAEPRITIHRAWLQPRPTSRSE